MKRIISFMLAFMMVLGMMPVGEMVVFADDAKPKVTKVEISKTHSTLEDLGELLILVEGENLNNLQVQIIGEDNKLKLIDKAPASNEFVAQYFLDAAKAGEKVYIQGKSYSLEENKMPRITSRNPSNGTIDIKEEIKIYGSNIASLQEKDGGSYNIESYFTEGTNPINLNPQLDIKSDDGTYINKKWGTEIGHFNLVFKRSYTNPSTSVPVEIKHTYNSVVVVQGELDVSKDIEMFPTQGARESQVTLEANMLIKDLSIFLLKGKDDEYTLENMVSNDSISFTKGKDGGKDTIKFEIPKTIKDLGPKHVVLTNKVDPSKGNISGQVNKYKLLLNKDGKTKFFTIIDGDNGVKLDSVQPYESSTKGINAILKGERIVSVSDNLYKNGKLDSIKKVGSDKLVVIYKGGTYDEEPVTTLTKEITIIIGNKATFRGKDYIADNGDEKDDKENIVILGDTFDEIKIKVPEVEDVEESIKKDIHVQIDNSIIFKEDGKKVDFIEADILEGDKGFTFHPKSITPEIDKGKDAISPNVITVDSNNKVVDDMTIVIKGKKFLKFNYVDPIDGRKIKNPEVSIANQPESEGWFDNKGIRVMVNDDEIDGRTGRQEGNKIKVKILKGTPIPPSIINNDDDGKIKSDIKVTNPLRVETNKNDMGPFAIGEIIFKKENISRKPIIDEIDPSIVSTTSGEKVIIKGEKFFEGVTVYVDGDLVNGVVRVSENELTFNAPKKSKGTYTIRVQNDKGEVIFKKDFIYTVTSKDTKISDFNPKRGENGTEVYMKGDSFKTPSTSVRDNNDKLDMLNFIGSTILFRKSGTSEKYVDMNEYNLNGSDVIELLPYKSEDKDIVIRKKDGSDSLQLSDYAHSVIFEDIDNPGQYYKIYQETKTGNFVLEGGLGVMVDGEEDNDNQHNIKDKFILKYDSNDRKIKATGISDTLVLDATSEGITVGSLNLKMKTPYRIDGKTIVGNNVKVLDDRKTIEFKVNLKSDDPDKKIQNGIYDVIVMNPDTHKVTAKGKFEYVATAQSKPKISRIDHIEEGSIIGGYNRTIIGTDFVEGASIYLGEKEVAPENITVVSKSEIKVIIPKYEGNIAVETEHGRRSVPLTVLNKDGGSASYDFVYVNPDSKPVIDSLFTNFGALTGGKEVTIYEGDQFKFDSYYVGVKPDNYKDLRIKNDRESLTWDEQLDILPKVFFGDRLAEIIKYDTDGKNSRGKKTITVIAPKGVQGKVSVYLENNDFGISNKVDFDYRKIDIGTIEIKPGTGKKQGNTSAEIRSTDKDKKEIFSESEINVFDQEGNASEKKHQLVRFGNRTDLNMSNISIDGNMDEAEKESSGRIVNNNADVKVGNLEVSYTKDDDNDKEKLSFVLKDVKYDDKKEEYEEIEYKFVADFPKGEDEVFLPIELLKNGSENYKGFELVKISKDRFTVDGKLSNEDKLIVERGYSPDTVVKQNGEYIELKVPSYYSIGEVAVTVINADGSDASTKYIYTNPANNPEISDVYREGNPTTAKERDSKKKVMKVDYKGGVKIHIKGSEFRKPSRIDIGGSVSISGERLGEDNKGIEHLPQVADKEDYEELVFIMPEVPEDYVGKEFAFIVTTPYDEKGESFNSATTSSADGDFKIYVEFTKGETNPKITKVTPNQGASSGGTEVTIEGEDFRKKDPEAGLYGELRVFVGENEVPKESVRFINSKKLIITTPAHESGTVKIKVENPDGAIAQGGGNNDTYTYVSNPKITKVVDPLNGDIIKESLSIEGGEVVQIVGSDFLEGARVVFSPVLKEVSENEGLSGERIFINGTEYILESGTPGVDAERIDSNNIKVKTPTGVLGTGGVIVINTDKAATPIYKLDYAIPEISGPREVRASLINNEYIRINWDPVTDKDTANDGKTVQYEVYVIEGNSRQFIGTTGTTGFIFRDIKSDKRKYYKFLVRSIGKYGSSKPIEESMSNEVRVDKNSGPKDNDGELGEKTKVDKSGNTANVTVGNDAFGQAGEYVIDTTRGVLSGSTDVVISISAKTVIDQRNKKIKVIGKDYALSFNLSVFENATVIANRSNPNAGVKFEVSPSDTNFDLTENKGDTILSSKYFLRGRAFVGASSNEVENLNGKMSFALDYDNNMAKARRLEDNVRLAKYDKYKKAFKDISKKSSYGTSSGEITELGAYAVIGSRR